MDSAASDPVHNGSIEIKLEPSFQSDSTDFQPLNGGLAVGASGDAVVSEINKWPGWPGHNAFRIVMPVMKVGCLIGRKGELIRRMCDETGARIRILEGVIGTNDRIVLISAKEEPEVEFSPAMNGVLQVFKRIIGISDGEPDSEETVSQTFCSLRLLMASSQAISLIGKGGAIIKFIQETSGASIRVLPGEDLPFYAVSDERVVESHGEPLRVLKALELIVKQLRKFLVDQSVIPLYERNLSSSTPFVVQDRVIDKIQSLGHVTSYTGISNDHNPPLKLDRLCYDRESNYDSHGQRSGLSLYGQDPALTVHHPPALARSVGAIVTQVTQTMQIPLSYAESIIGIGGANIAYIRRSSGAILTVQESRGLLDEITVEIKGSATQVQTAQQLIQDFIANHREPASHGYNSHDPAGYMSIGGSGAYSRSGPGASSYLPSTLPSQYYGSSGGMGGGGYGNYRY
ncbi:putative Poly(RC)-binding protein [Zostera marina]|uniref:Putative Poly(RC)-binding protein n=1 Tax=Zostera marina TaxID=29655 RepID=A0A0K9Q279_ZOSMR|nr:putative Poly(RC)-binding protein [Zostera marina]